MKIRKETAWLIAWALLALVLCGGCAALYARTLVSLWGLLAVTVPLGLLAGLLARTAFCRLPGFESAVAGTACAAALFASAITFGALLLNYGAARDVPHEERAVIERLYSETHREMRRVGRRYSTTGREYRVYYMEISFEGGRRKKVSLGRQGYGRRRTGDTLLYSMRRGALGFPVIAPK